MRQILMILGCYAVAAAALAAALLLRAADQLLWTRFAVALCSAGVLVGTCLLFGRRRAKRRLAVQLPQPPQTL